MGCQNNTAVALSRFKPVQCVACRFFRVTLCVARRSFFVMRVVWHVRLSAGKPSLKKASSKFNCYFVSAIPLYSIFPLSQFPIHWKHPDILASEWYTSEVLYTFFAVNTKRSMVQPQNHEGLCGTTSLYNKRFRRHTWYNSWEFWLSWCIQEPNLTVMSSSLCRVSHRKLSVVSGVESCWC